MEELETTLLRHYIILSLNKINDDDDDNNNNNNNNNKIMIIIIMRRRIRFYIVLFS